MLFVVYQYSGGKLCINMRALRLPALQKTMDNGEGCPEWKLTKPGLSEQVAVLTYLQEMVWRNPDPEHSRHHDFSVRHIYGNEASKWSVEMGRKRTPVLFKSEISVRDLHTLSPPLTNPFDNIRNFRCNYGLLFPCYNGMPTSHQPCKNGVWNPSF